MADILIKNMEMPKNYPYRMTLYSDGHIEDHTGYSGHGHYQAIELPPHGRLVSVDEVQKKMSYYGFHAIDMTIHEFIEDELTTILEANNG